MTDSIRNKGREQREGKQEAPVLRNTEAKGEGEKVNRQVDDSRFEELKRVVLSVEHDYFGGSGKCEPFVSYAQYCASIGRRFSLHERGAYFTWHEVSDATGRNIKIDHNVTPILVRLVIERVPQCLPYIEVRRSKWDKVFSERRAYVAAQEASRTSL